MKPHGSAEPYLRNSGLENNVNMTVSRLLEKMSLCQHFTGGLRKKATKLNDKSSCQESNQEHSHSNAAFCTVPQRLFLFINNHTTMSPSRIWLDSLERGSASRKFSSTRYNAKHIIFICALGLETMTP